MKNIKLFLSFLILNFSFFVFLKINVTAMDYSYYYCSRPTIYNVYPRIFVDSFWTKTNMYKKYPGIPLCNSTSNKQVSYCWKKGLLKYDIYDAYTTVKQPAKSYYSQTKANTDDGYACAYHQASSCSSIKEIGACNMWSSSVSNQFACVWNNGCREQYQNTASVNGCYYCRNIGFVYYTAGTVLDANCSATPSDNYVKSGTSTCVYSSDPSNPGSSSPSTPGSSSPSNPSSGPSPSDPGSTIIIPTTDPEIKVATPVSDPEVVIEHINGYRFTQSGAGYQGDNVSCGDKVYVTTCVSNYCNISSINDKTVFTTTKVYKSKLSTSDNATTCGNMTRYIRHKDYYYTNKNKTAGQTDISCGTIVRFTSSPSVACDSTLRTCEVEYNGNKIYVDEALLTTTKPDCSNACESSKPVKNLKGETTVKICYQYDRNEITEKDLFLDDAVTCASGYVKSYNLISDTDTCKDVLINGTTCTRNYKFNCELATRPSVSSSGGVVGSDGKGMLTLTAIDENNIGIKGYFLSNGTAPTVSSAWKKFTGRDLTAYEVLPAGTYFVWAINNKDRISYSVMSRIYDSDPSTTLKQIELKSADGKTTYTASAVNTGEKIALNNKDLNYVRLTNNLISDSQLASFDSYNTAYEVTVNNDKIAVYATLTSDDAAYVPEFEPRTVNLDYGRNVILIKIVNKQGRERTYTIIANRIDDRESNNLLRDLTLSTGDISFDPYVSDYNVEVPSNASEVTINGTLASDKALFLKGYEPRRVTLASDVTSAVIKTISEAGIVRSYVITFIKSGTEINNDINSSVYLSSLSVPGTQLEFDKNTTSYNISVGYEIEELPVYAFAESPNAVVVITGNQKFKIGTNVVQIEVKNAKKTKIYNLYITRKQDGLNITSDTLLSSLSVQDYDIKFKPEVYDYTVEIEKERSLVITATPNSNRAEVYMFGNNDLTGFSTIRIKVIAENGTTGLYSIDIKKAAFDKKLETALSIGAGILVVLAGIIILVYNRNKKRKNYLEV